MIKIIDDIAGSGKTTYIINKMNSTDDSMRFCYVTPFLEEIKRIKKCVKKRTFYDPIHIGYGKLQPLKELIISGKDIATTHSLLKYVDEETIELLKTHNYTLVLDEVLEVVQHVKISKGAVEMLLDHDYIVIDEQSCEVLRGSNKQDVTEFREFFKMVDTRRVAISDGSFFVWCFPTNIFSSFCESYILTYLFNGSLMKPYFDMHNIKYKFYSIEKDINSEYIIINHRNPNLHKYRNLINIVDGVNINKIGDDKTSLSYSWYYKKQNNNILIKKLKSNINNYFKNITKCKSKDFLWTTFKDKKQALKMKGYLKETSFCPHNARSINSFGYKTVLAYTVNRFIDPYLVRYFKLHGVEVDVDIYALSEMVQWIFRSAIRNDIPITVYIPSKRMRELFINWLEGK